MSVDYPIGTAGVEALLPHRAPMLFIDRVLSCADDTIHAQVMADPDWPLFQGHFPGRPILPGVIMVEMIAQAGALIGALSGRLSDNSFLAFSGVDKARFRRPVKPGDKLDIYAQITGSRRGFYKFSGRVEVDGFVATQLEFSATLMQFGD